MLGPVDDSSRREWLPSPCPSPHRGCSYVLCRPRPRRRRVCPAAPNVGAASVRRFCIGSSLRVSSLLRQIPRRTSSINSSVPQVASFTLPRNAQGRASPQQDDAAACGCRFRPLWGGRPCPPYAAETAIRGAPAPLWSARASAPLLLPCLTAPRPQRRVIPACRGCDGMAIKLRRNTNSEDKPTKPFD